LGSSLALVFRKACGFLYNDFLNETSYKFSFVTQVAGIFFTATCFFFLSRVFGQAVSPYLEPYGGDYFSFVLIGIALVGYLHVSLSSFSKSIRDAQILGTLEALLVTQTGIPTIILCSSLYSFLMTTFRIFVFILFGVLVLGMDLHGGNFGAALLILLVTVVCFSSFGILSASFIMVLKKGNPLGWAFTSLSWLVGGVYYPISVLPKWLQAVAHVLPITYSLEGMRLALLQGRSLGDLLPTLLVLLAFTAVLLPVSLVAFSRAVRKAKTDGTLMQY
jgi:ABC-2 type transport system permease protein